MWSGEARDGAAGDTVELFPQQPTALPANGTFELTLRLAVPRDFAPEPGADVVRLTLHFGRAHSTVTRSHTLHLLPPLQHLLEHGSPAAALGLVARQWAQAKLAHLAVRVCVDVRAPAHRPL